MAGGKSQEGSGTVIRFGFLHFCPQTVQGSTAVPGLWDVHGVFSDPSPATGIKKPRFLANSLWPALVCALLVPAPRSRCPSCPTGAVPSVPHRPARAPTHQRALGWPPAPRPGRGGPGLPLAPPAQPCCWLCCVPPGSLRHSGPRRRLAAGLAARGDNGSLLCPAKARGQASASVPALCLLPRARGCSGHLGHAQHRDTSHGEGGTCFPRRSVAGERVLCLGITIAGRETSGPFPSRLRSP